MPLAVVATDDDDDATTVGPGRSGRPDRIVAGAVSMLAHATALVALAMVYQPEHRLDEPRFITWSAADVEEDFTEDHALGSDEQIKIVRLAAPAGVPALEDVPALAGVDAGETVPLAVELGDFGSETAPADVLSRIDAAGSFGSRANAAAIAAQEGGGGDTEAAVDRALAWLGEHQLDDGSWSFNLAECPRCRGTCRHSGTTILDEDRVGATALALLPFLGRGHTHRDGSFQRSIDRGIAVLADTAVRCDGVMYAPGSAHGLYVQGLAGIALSECYGMTRDRRLARPTQLVINHIMAAQDPHGGGWRYGPGQAGDTSVVGWQIMALKSAHMAYLQVHPRTIARAVQFLDSVQADAGATYGYMDNSDPQPGRSAIGLLCRMHLGWKRDNPSLQDGVARLAAIGPTENLYYDYYATQLMHHIEGDAWLEWNEKMKSLLLRTQATAGHEAGSWYEGVDGGFADRSISPARVGGRLYCTSLATMILEVYYRHLPIYRTQSVEEAFQE
jgi:hypothetical protein